MIRKISLLASWPFLRTSIFAAAMMLAGGAGSWAQVATDTTATESAQLNHPDTRGSGWVDLIADDFSNANAPKTDEGQPVWSWENRVLTATQDQSLWTKERFGNCILDLEFKNESGTNSGVIVYTSDMDNWIPNSVEIQITDDYHEHWAKSPKTWQCGAIFGRLAASQQTVKPAGEWNRFTIYCEGKTIRVVLNGVEVTHINMDDWKDAKKNPDGSEIPAWLSKPLAELPTEGYIGLQGKHGEASIHFRNLRIKRM